MLSLDLTGAFDNVSQERLIYILRQKGFPDWVVNVVHGFMAERSTTLIFTGFKSQEYPTQTGIPQGSPISPALFLLFACDLLWEFEDTPVQGIGFVDDTNLLVYGPTAESNCRQLERAHEICARWATNHGAKFSPEKYKLIHFTRKRKLTDDLKSKVDIRGFDGEPVNGMRVLGVWVDRKMTWKQHVQNAQEKGRAQFDAFARVVASTWGPSFQKSRLLYTAVVRPTLLYGIETWAPTEAKQKSALIDPLEKVQTATLKKVLGAYKRAPTAAVQRETAVPPLALYTEARLIKSAQRVKDTPVTQYIAAQVQKIWQRCRHNTQGPAPPLRVHILQNAAAAIEEEETERHEAANAERARRRRRLLRYRKQPIREWAQRKWKARWETAAAGKRAPVWKTKWETDPRTLRAGLTKAENTVATLLRTEVLGLNDWLYFIGKPGTTPSCDCGWERQTPRHIVLACPRYSGRDELFARAGTDDYTTLLTTNRGLKATAQWFIQQGILQQFAVARELAADNTKGRNPLPSLQ
jgi:hypothetical protein